MFVRVIDLLSLVLGLTEIGIVMHLFLVPGLRTTILAQEATLRMVAGSTVLIGLLVLVVGDFLLV